MSREWSPLTTHFQVNLADCLPRRGDIVGIGHHHTASPSKSGSLAQFLPGGREVTPNYFIWGREIWGIVPETLRAFTTGSATFDGGSITYEIGNSGGAPDWPFDPETLETVARLDADVADYYGIPRVHGFPGFWEHRDVYGWTNGRESYITVCAGPSFHIGAVIAASSTAATGDQQRLEEEEDMAAGTLIKETNGTIWHLPDDGTLVALKSMSEVEALVATGAVRLIDRNPNADRIMRYVIQPGDNTILKLRKAIAARK